LGAKRIVILSALLPLGLKQNEAEESTLLPARQVPQISGFELPHIRFGCIDRN
jgi:hypothetical protein